MLFNIDHKKQAALELSVVVPKEILVIIQEAGTFSGLKNSNGLKSRGEKRWTDGQCRSVMNFFFYIFAYSLLPQKEIFFNVGKNYLKLKFSRDSKSVLAQHFGGQNGNIEDFAVTTMTDLHERLSERCSFNPNAEVKGKKTFLEDPSDENLIERFKAFLWNRLYFAHLDIVDKKEDYTIVDIDSVGSAVPYVEDKIQLSLELKQCLMKLSDAEREIIYLRDLEGLSFSEIGAMSIKTDENYDLSPNERQEKFRKAEGSARVRYHRALKALKDFLTK